MAGRIWHICITVSIVFLTYQVPVIGGEFTDSEIDIADDWLSQAVAIKYGSSDAVHDYDGKIEAYSQDNTITGGPLNGSVYSRGYCAADVTGAGTGEINSSAEMLYHVYSPTDDSVNIGTSSQTLKPFMVNSSGDTSVEITFDGLLITNETSASASEWSKATVEYMAEIQEYDSDSSSRSVVGDNTFDGVAWLYQEGNSSAATVVVPETYVWMEDEGASDNSWYNNGNLTVIQVVASGASGDQINVGDIEDTNTRASAQTAIDAGRTVYFLEYTETFDFSAEADKTYYVYMDLQTSAVASSSADWTNTAYALSDFSNTINFTVTSGGQSVSTIVDLSDATLNIDNGNPTMGEDYVITSGNTGNVSIDSGQTGTFTGDFSGAGTLKKSGDGTMVVSGSNTYSGGTTVSEGTLRLDNSNSLPTTGDVAVSSGASLNLSDNNQTIDALSGGGSVILGSATLNEGGNDGSSTFSGIISGTGDLNKSGDGTLNLTGTNTTTGTLNITDGTVAVNGTWAGAAEISSGAILQGTGVISSNVINSGRYAPGNSIGTQTISGNYTQPSGGTLEIEVANQDNNSDKIVVSGSVSVDGTLYVSQTEKITGTKNYSDVISAGSISDGTFDTVTGDNELLYDYAATVDGTTIDLAVTQTADFSDFAGSGSSGVGGVLDRITSAGTQTGVLANVIDTIGSSSASNASNQISQLSPVNNTNVMSNMSVGLNNAFTQSVGQYVANARTSARRAYAGLGRTDKYLASADRMYYSGYEKEDSRMQGFVKAFGTKGDREATSDFAGYDYEIYGTIVGMNKLLSKNLIGGLALGYSFGNANTSDGLVDNNLETFSTSLYGSWFNYDSHFDVALGYGHNWYDVERRIPVASKTASSKPESDLWSVTLEAGKSFYYDNLSVEPFVGMSYSVLQSGDYEESGAGTAGLAVDKNTSEAIDSTLGVKLSKVFDLGERPLLSCITLGWRHNYSDSIQTTSKFIGNNVSFEADGIGVVRDTALMGIELESELKKDLKLFVDLDTEFSNQFTSYAGQIGIKFAF